MSKALKHNRSIAPLMLAFVAAALVAGCGTDEEASRTQVSKSGVRTTPPVDVAPTTREPVVTVLQTPEPPREVTYEEAETAYNARRYDEASDLFARYIERKPGNPWGHYMLGLSAWKAGRLDTAETAFRQALALDTTHVKSHVNLTRVLLDAGRPGEAYTTIDNALIIDESSAVAWRLKGRVCDDLERGDEAIAAYRHAIQLDPADAWSMNNLAYLHIRQGRFEEALGPLARAIELQGDVAVFHNNLGMALERTGHLQAAEDAYAAAIAADPTNEKAASNGERIAAVLKSPDETPVDLTELARGFVTETQSWDASSLATASPRSAEPVSAPATVSETDSTAAGPRE